MRPREIGPGVYEHTYTGEELAEALKKIIGPDMDPELGPLMFDFACSLAGQRAAVAILDQMKPEPDRNTEDASE